MLARLLLSCRLFLGGSNGPQWLSSLRPLSFYLAVVNRDSTATTPLPAEISVCDNPVISKSIVVRVAGSVIRAGKKCHPPVDPLKTAIQRYLIKIHRRQFTSQHLRLKSLYTLTGRNHMRPQLSERRRQHYFSHASKRNSAKEQIATVEYKSVHIYKNSIHIASFETAPLADSSRLYGFEHCSPTMYCSSESGRDRLLTQWG